MTNAAPPLDYKLLVPAKTPFPAGKIEFRIPPEVLELAKITSERAKEQLPPDQVYKIRKTLGDTSIDSGVNGSFQPRAIPSRVFFDVKSGESFSVPREGAFEMQVRF